MRQYCIVTLAIVALLFINLQNCYCQSSKAKAHSSPKTKYTEEQALDFISDWYSFYNADETYSDPIVRRISNNVFYVSVKYCSGGESICYTQDSRSILPVKNSFFWHSKVLVLTILSKTKYSVKEKHSF